GELSNTSIAMLPPNTTSSLQPQDAGVIRSFKAKLSRMKTQDTIRKAEKLLQTVVQGEIVKNEDPRHN
ncbi:unnamed protein product, partial [Aphanomyces euteiches]